MNPFKKLALTFTAALTLLAGDAMAQCGGKTVYVQIPTEGSWSKTSINILWEGNIRPSVTATAEGTQFVRFTFPTSVPNDGSGKTFSLSMKSTQIDEGNRWIASGSRYNITGNRPTDAQGISCSSFGTGSTLYIYPNPTSATTTVVRTDPPNARYFYFLPPNDKDWILNAPYLWEGNVSTKLEVDPDRCGWYRKVYFSTPPSDNEALILQTPKDAAASSKNKIGVYGMAEDPVDWVDGIPTPIKLKSKFDEVLNCNGCGGDLFFVAEGDKMGWSKTDPMIDERNRCSYGFAARIYDTDAIANTSFFDYDCLSGNSAGTASSIGGGSGDGSGILTGIVKTELSNGKIQWQGTSKSTTSCSGLDDGWTDVNFEKAFKSTPGSNVVRCYDMPFQRTRDNLWEFDSNKLCSDGTIDLDGTCTATRGKFLGGFFPPELQSRGEGDYSQCPNCDKKRAAQGWVELKLDDATKEPAISKWCYDRGYLGPSSVTGVGLASSEASRVCTGGAFKDGDFRNGDVPNPSFLTGTSIWQWDDSRDDRIASGLIGTGPVITSTDGWSNRTMLKNGLFCFESAPALFTYEKGQEFFFSGDDDIWVFINNKLELDLGGTHLAAPGYISLDNLKNSTLVEGERYPINIFFCDRRTTMSNIRIKTNLYFAQETGLSLATKDPSVKGDVCLKRSGGGSCADVTGGISGESLSCGTDINSGLEYYLRNRAGTSGDDLGSIGLPGSKGIRLNSSNEDCVAGNVDSEGNAYILCYGGIKIYNRLGKVQVLTDEIADLAGTWQVWVTHNEDPHPTLKVSEFTKMVKVQVVWGEVRTDGGKLMDNLHPTNSACVAAGETVKIGFAAAEPTADNKFYVLMDSKGGSPGQSFSIAPTSLTAPSVAGSSLTLCYDADCSTPVAGTSFSIPRIGQPSEGLLVLYAKGNFEAAGDAEYAVKVQGSSPEFKLKVYQPRGLFLQQAATGKEICLREGITDNTCTALTAAAVPVCGVELVSFISYSLAVPEVGNVPLDAENPDCVWFGPAQGVCYSGIALNSGVVSVNEEAIPEYLKILGFEIYASVPNYTPLNVSNTEPITPIVKILPVFRSQEPAYYNLKGEPLGKQKPKKTGVYIIRQNGVSKVEVVK